MKAEAGGRSIAAVLPGTGAWLIPPGVCPACWPAYAGATSSLGLGLALGAAFLVPLLALLLALAPFALGYRAEKRRGYRPLVLGGTGGLGVLAGKLWFSSEALSCVTLAAIVAAGLWNSWPERSGSAPCTGPSSGSGGMNDGE